MSTAYRLQVLSFLLLFFTGAVFSQRLESGPMIGYVEHREALIWIAVDSSVKQAEIRYWPALQDKSKMFKIAKDINSHSAHIPVSFILPELEMNTRYLYELTLNGKVVSTGIPQEFITKELWEWRKAAPDFSFLFGSCAYINDSVYDRPGKPYGQSLKIFGSMADTKAEFNLWGGDNLYFREADYSSQSGLLYRYSHDRKTSELKKLLALRPNYAVWDDHDYGQNDANSSYELKNRSRDLFTSWWGNKTYGEDDEGIYSRFSWSDCDFFLLDDRWFRSANNLPDSINGVPNRSKVMLGAKQLTWFMNAIASSRATFKFVVVGGQVVNPLSAYECLYAFPSEYNELMKFLEDSRIEGIVFLSGDRHMTELIKLERKDSYPLYDFTCSPLSSGTFKLTENHKEFNNPYRVRGSLINENNYSRISVKGDKTKRTLLLEVMNADGKPLWQHSIEASELKYKKTKP